MSSNFQMFAQVLWNFIAFQVLYQSLFKIEEHQRKVGSETEQGHMVLPSTSSALFLSWKKKFAKPWA